MFPVRVIATGGTIIGANGLTAKSWISCLSLTSGLTTVFTPKNYVALEFRRLI